MNILDYMISDVERSASRFIKAVSFVPDDKLSFFPAEECMSAREIAAHIIVVNAGYLAYIFNQPRPYKSFQELFELSKKEGAKYTSTKTLLSDLEKSFANLLENLRTLPPDTIQNEIQTVRGSEKVQSVLERLAPHVYLHTGQIDYLQTIWGDHQVHL